MSVVKSCTVSASLCVHSQFPNMRFHIAIAVKMVDVTLELLSSSALMTEEAGGCHQTLAPVCHVIWNHIPEDVNFNLLTSVSLSSPFSD
jgi:hypothetical protein